MSLDASEIFSPHKQDGILLARDQVVHDQTIEKMKSWLNKQRVHLEPVVDTLVKYEYHGREHLGVGPDTEFLPIIADHLSQFNGCPLKALKSKQKAQALLDAGEDYMRPITENQVVIFGMGYVFQDGIMGRGSEVALWRPYSEDRLSGGFYFSPDAMTFGEGTGVDQFEAGGLPHQIKTTRKSPSTKADREITMEVVKKSGVNAGETYMKPTGVFDPTWSVEKGILEKFPFYWDYEKQSMYLFNVNQSYLTFWWISAGDQMTFKLTVDQEEIDAKGAELEARIKFQRQYQAVNELPDPESRLDPKNCNAYNEPCPFLSEDPCMSRIPVLDLMASGN